jgi:hypothetical protein
MKLYLSFFRNPKFGQNATSCEDSYIKLYRYNAWKIFEKYFQRLKTDLYRYILTA